MLLRQPDEQLVMENGERVRRNDQAAARLASKFGDSLFDFGGVADRGLRYLNCDLPRLGLEWTQGDIIRRGRVPVVHEGRARNAGGGLFGYLQPIPHPLEIYNRGARYLS